MRFTTVPEGEREEYSTVFDNLWRFVIEVSPKMTMYAVLLQEDIVRRLIAMVRSSDVLQSYLFLIYGPGFDMSTTTIVAHYEPAEVHPRTCSCEDNDEPGPTRHHPIQPSLGCYALRESTTTTSVATPDLTASTSISPSAATNNPQPLLRPPQPSVQQVSRRSLRRL